MMDCYNASNPKSFYIEDKRITRINLGYTNLSKFPKTLKKFAHIRDLILNYNDKHLIPDSIRKVENVILSKVQYDGYHQSIFDEVDCERF